MKSIKLITCLLGFISSFNANAQQKIVADATKWTTQNSKANFEKGDIHLINTSNKVAFLWLNNTEFKNGTIELDIKGNAVDGESFLGLAFHALDEGNYDAIYFRPPAFRNPEKQARSIQYISIPGNDWDILREKFPGKYESTVNPVPDPDDWFHVKIVINSPTIKVYVNGSSNPSLTVEKIGKKDKGKIGFWIDSKDGFFRNLVVSPAN